MKPRRYEQRRYGQDVTHETRSEAHDKVDKAKRYRQIKKILSNHPEGLTAKEVAALICHYGFIPFAERNFSAPRLTEMCESGEVEPIGKKICQYTGRKVSLYALRREA